MNICIIQGCDNEREPNRRYCREHYLARQREASKSKYAEQGRFVYRDLTCANCGKQFNGCRKDQQFCSHSCYRAAVTTISCQATNNYEPAGGGGYCWKHRRIAEEALRRPLASNECVHHLNLKPKDNSPDNLVVLTRQQHGKLHAFLNKQVAALEKVNAEYRADCSDNRIVSITRAWLETTGANVIKISEIGQTASDSLANGEGPELVRVIPKE